MMEFLCISPFRWSFSHVIINNFNLPFPNAIKHDECERDIEIFSRKKNHCNQVVRNSVRQKKRARKKPNKSRKRVTSRSRVFHLLCVILHSNPRENDFNCFYESWERERRTMDSCWARSRSRWWCLDEWKSFNYFSTLCFVHPASSLMRPAFSRESIIWNELISRAREELGGTGCGGAEWWNEISIPTTQHTRKLQKP